jgi:hypothetical protein
LFSLLLLLLLFSFVVFCCCFHCCCYCLFSLFVPRVRWKEDQVRPDCSPHPLRWPCVSDFACYDF